MTIKIHSDSDKPDSHRRHAPDYFSRSVKLRLAALVAALGLVLIMMNEARKPETWAVIGFGSVDTVSAESPHQLDSRSPLPETDATSRELQIDERLDPLSVEPGQNRDQHLNSDDANVYAAVEDRSSMNRSVERSAWNYAWNRILVSPAEEPFEAVSYVQLMGQPEAYRGHYVEVNGSVRGVEEIDLPGNHELGFDSYKVLWIKPADSNQTPFCIYAKELPPDFPQPDNGFLTLNENVRVQGIFFKLRSYQATSDKIEICPLIVAETVQWQRRRTPDAAATWSPPNWLLVVFLIGMPSLAALMAWSVYRSTQFRRMQDDNKTHNRINEVLVDLSGNPNIKSDHEKILDLHLSDDSSNNVASDGTA